MTFKKFFCFIMIICLANGRILDQSAENSAASLFPEFTSQELDNLKKGWSLFVLLLDGDGDGKVTTKEQAKGVENLELLSKKPAVTEFGFRWMDMDGNGFVSAAEFRKNLNFLGVYPTDEYIQGIWPFMAP